MELENKLKAVAKALTSVGIDTARREARLLVKYAALIDESRQIADPGMLLTSAQEVAIDDMLQRRMAGEPLSRILGRQSFYSLNFMVSSATLDPRPETEILVDQALKWLATRSERPLTLLDLGTGTGCIPISILKNNQDVHAVAVDLSDQAIAVATQNAHDQGVLDRLTFVRSDWFSALPEIKFDLIVSNPPYIPLSDIPNLMPEVRGFDPILALSGGVDGLDPYRIIFNNIHNYIKPGGMGLFEIGVGQVEDIKRIAIKSGLDVCDILNDYAGIPRVVGVFVHR